MNIFQPFLMILFDLYYLPMTWFDFLTTPFTGFTFTDASDFLFAGMIVATLPLILVRHIKRPYPIAWTRFASASSFLLAVLTPLVPLVALYVLSRHAETVIGHWPRMWVDDPKYICQGDSVYRKLTGSYVYASAFAGWGLFTWSALLLHLRRSLSRRQWWWQIGIFVAAWAAFLAEPGERYLWWID